MDFIYQHPGRPPDRREDRGALPQRRGRPRLHLGRPRRRRTGARSRSRSSATPSTTCSRVAPEGMTPKLTIPSPSMVHYRGGTAAIDPVGLPRRGPVLGRPVGGVRPTGADDRRARLPLPPARRHQPRLPQRPRAARQRRRAGSRRRAPARALHPPDQRGDQGPARGAVGDHAHVPRQLPLLVGGLGQLRLRRRGAVQRARRGRLLPGVRRRALRRLRAAALRARRASRSCSAWSPPRARRWRARTTSSAASTRPPKYVPLDQLCLSPQCGFSSTVEGNNLTQDEEIAKLRLVVETAQEVWG